MLKKNAANAVDIYDERCLTNSADHPPEVRIGNGLDNVIHLGRLVPETYIPRPAYWLRQRTRNYVAGGDSRRRARSGCRAHRGRVASLDKMMHLQNFRGTAILASPAVPFEYLLAKYLVSFGMKL